MQKFVPIAFCLCVSAGVSADTFENDRAEQTTATTARPATYQPSTGRGAKTLGAILFRTDSAEVEQALWPVLFGTVALAKEHPNLIVELAGHADNRGSRNHNRSLSSRRVESVATFLVRNGVPSERIRTHAYGESRASIKVNDASRHIFDRRVTITLRGMGFSA